MCDGDLDTILSYLSSKINKIFCDREFVGCVKEDFDIILKNAGNRCVVFPKLKPIFLKVLRHQAVIFDLSVFCVGSGPNQLAVVCKKAFFKEQTDECPPEESKQASKAMDGEENAIKTPLKKANRTNRPTQPFYVPPAQRSSTRKNIDHENNKTSKKTRIKSKPKHKDTEKSFVEREEIIIDSNISQTKTTHENEMTEKSVPVVNNTFELPNNRKQEEEECGACLNIEERLPSLESSNINEFSNSIEKEVSDEYTRLPPLLNLERQYNNLPCTEVVNNISQLPNVKEQEEKCEACVNIEEEPLQRFPILESSNINESVEKEPCNEYTEPPTLNLERVFNNLATESVQNKYSFSKNFTNTVLDDIPLVVPPETNEQVQHQSIKVQTSEVNEELFSGSIEQKQNVQSNLGGSPKSSHESCKDELGLHDLDTLTESILPHSTENLELDEVIDNLKTQHQTNKTLSQSNEGVDKIIELLETVLTEDNNYETEELNGYTKEQVSKEVLIQKLQTHFNASPSLAASDDKCINSESDPDLPNSLSLSNNVDDGDSDVNSPVIIPPPLLEKSDSADLQIVQSEQETVKESNCSDIPPLYISYNDDVSKKKAVDCDIDNENEEMQRAIKNINRKSRSLIKHNIRNVNTLRIDENEQVPQRSSSEHENKKKGTSERNSLKEDNSSVSNWEDMFDDSGDLQPEYIGEIVKRIGCDVKVVKASHDYSAYENTKYQDLEHVIELYDFPSTFKTQDLIQLYRGASQDPMYIKWCDDTHALLVLSTPAQAQRALQIEHEVIKARPLSQASAAAALTASSADLKPAMKRPQTSMQTARRLINTHLGTKSKLSKEEVEQERRALRDAREQRRQERQNEKDAWEGRPRSAKPHAFS